MLDSFRTWIHEIRSLDPQQRQAAGWAFAWFFCLLAAYFMIRPIRETMGITGGVKQLKWLFGATFIAMLAVVPAYSYLVSAVSRRRLVYVSYSFFALCILGFFFALQVDQPEAKKWIARVFFVWISVFALFNTSIFWSVLTDIFTQRQAKRLFGIIAVGGTTGGIVGSLLTGLLSDKANLYLLLLPITMLAAGLFCASRLFRTVDRMTDEDEGESVADGSQEGQATGGSIFGGVLRIFQSPYLALICVFLMLLQLCGTHFYMVQAELVAQLVEGEANQTRLFGWMNLAVQIGTLFVQGIVVGPLLRLGLPVALVILPIIYGSAFLALGIAPAIATLFICDVIRRSTAYGVLVPSREVLFTVVSREDKYKTKSFIDTVVMRGGDALSGQLFGAIKYLKVAMASMNFAMIPVAFVWGAIGIHLGFRQAAIAKSRLESNTGIENVDRESDT